MRAALLWASAGALSAFQGDPSEDARLKQLISAESAMRNGNYSGALATLDIACPLADLPEMFRARCLHDRASLADALGERGKALDLYRKAAASWTEGLGPQNAGLADTLAGLSDAARGLGLIAEAEEAARRNVAIRKNLEGPSSGRSILAASQLGRILLEEGRIAEAAQWIENAYQLAQAPSSALSKNARILMNMGALRLVQGRVAEADTLLRRVAGELSRGHPPDGELAEALFELAVICEQEGRKAEASTLLRRAAPLMERVYGPNSPHLASVRREQALLALSENHPAIAEALLNQALAAVTTAPQGTVDVVAFQNSLGLALIEQRRYPEAEALLLRVAGQEERGSLAGTVDRATNLANLGLLKERQKNFTEAASYYKDSLAICESIGTTGPVLAEILTAYARVVRSNNPGQAKALRKRAAAALNAQNPVR